jgi:hypothetical protein
MTCRCRVCTADRWARRACWALIVVGVAYFALRVFV